MSLTLNLGKVSVKSGTFAESTVEIGSKNYTVAAGETVLSLVDTEKGTDTGKLTLSEENVLTFTAGEDFSGTLTEGTAPIKNSATLKAVDFSKAGGAVTFDAGTKAVVTITGSEYNDTLKSKVSGAAIDAGDGNDTIVFSGSGTANIDGGEGDDKISVTDTASVEISDKAGNDTYTISGKSVSVNIADDAGADTVKISGASTAATVKLSGDDSNTITIDSLATKADVKITVGDGDDNITSKAANATLDIVAGAGDDVITVSGKESYVNATAGNGDDVIDIAKGADKSTVAISTGAGDDNIKITAASVTGSVDGGTGDDTLVISGANAELTVDAVDTVNLTGKNGAVTVTDGTINSSAVGATINAASVNVTDGTALLNEVATELTISKGSVTAKSSVTATVTGGTFVSKNAAEEDDNLKDSITVSGSGANVDAGKGADEIVVSEDAFGTNTLTLGDGKDSVTVEAGKGKVAITDLDSDNDTLILQDASEDTVISLSKTGVLNVVDAGQFNVTATVISGSYGTEDYEAAVKNKAKNDYFTAVVSNGEDTMKLYTASGTTKKVTIEDTTDAADAFKVDLSAAKSSEVTLSSSHDKMITLGSGEDKVSLAGTGKATVAGYNFANKDAITIAAADVILHNDGVLTTGIDEDETDYDDAKLVVSTTANGGVYAARLNGADYYTAKSGAVKISTDKETEDNVIDVANASSSTINVTAHNATIKNLTAGADVINVAKGATVNASAAVYHAAQGDVINLGKAKEVTINAYKVTDTEDGEQIVKTAFSATEGGYVNVADVAVAANNGLYVAKVVSDNNKKTNTFAAAVEDASINMDLSAAAYGVVAFDGQEAADVNVAIGAGDCATLSNGEDVITVNGLSKTTKEGAAIANFSLDDDKLVLSNVKLTDLTITSVTDGLEVNYGNKKPAANVFVGTATELGDDTTDVTININGTDVKAALTDTAVLEMNADSEDAFFLGNNAALLEITDDIENTVINLTDTSKYKDIHAVKVDDAAGITIIGTNDKKKGDAVDASGNESGVQVNLGAGTDSVTLSSGADVVWFDAKQGKNNEISSFTYGVSDEADILKITDVASLDKVKFTASDAGITVKDGSATANIKFALPEEESTSEVMKVQLGNKVYNVAADLNGDKKINLNLDDEVKVDSYVVTDKELAIALTSEDEVAYTYDKSVSKVNIDNIDGAGTNGAMKIFGVKNVTLGTSEAENSNVVWAKGDATITATAGAGNDQVWFQSGVDKKVTVEGFAAYSAEEANDNIKLVGTKSLANIAANYKFAVKDGNVVITGANSVSSKLTVSGTDTVVLTDDNGASYVAKVGAKGDTVDFTSDVKLYTGMTELASSSIEDNTTIMLEGGNGDIFGSKSDYYIGASVKNFDATGSTGDLVIIGGKTTANTLIGGEGNDTLYGGGATNDTMKGGEGANTFFYGENDGNDVIDGITDEDTIYMYSGSLTSFAYNETKDVFTFTLANGNTLTVNGDLAEGTKVQYAGATFVYQKDDHTFIQA